MRVSYDTMLAEFERVLKKYGFQAERAHDAAEIFAQNSLSGVYSHGLNRFPVVVDYLKKERLIQMRRQPVLHLLEIWNAGTGTEDLVH